MDFVWLHSQRVHVCHVVHLLEVIDCVLDVALLERLVSFVTHSGVPVHILT